MLNSGEQESLTKVQLPQREYLQTVKLLGKSDDSKTSIEKFHNNINNARY